MKPVLIFLLSLMVVLPAVASQPEPPAASAPRYNVNITEPDEPEWFKTTIDLNFKDKTLLDAIREVLHAAKVKDVGVTANFDIPKQKFYLTAKEVNVRDSLAALARFGGAQAFVVNQGGKVTIELRKRTNDLTSTLQLSNSVNNIATNPLVMFSGGPSVGSELLPTKTVKIAVENVTARELAKLVCNQAGIDFEIEKDVAADSRVTMRVNVDSLPLASALDLVASSMQCGWKAEKKDGKVRVIFGSSYRRARGEVFSNFARTFASGSPMPFPPMAPRSVTLRTAGLPTTLVSIDKHKSDPRDILKDLLKQADVSYVLSDDLPEEKKSFTFSDVPLATALNTICESIGARWWTEAGPSGKVIVHIAKSGRTRTTLGINLATAIVS